MEVLELNKDRLQQISAFSKENQEPSWLLENRLLAFELFKNEPVPDRVSHLWKYSDPLSFLTDFDKLELTSINLQLSQISKGLEIMPLSEAVKKYEWLLKEKLGMLDNNSNLKLSALNKSFWISGYFVYVSKNTNITEPVLLSLLPQKRGFYPVRNLIYLEEGSSINLIDKVYSDDDTEACLNITTEIFLESNSKLNIVNLQTGGKSLKSHLLQRSLLNKNAEMVVTFLSLGGYLTKADIGVELSQEKSSVSVFGIVLGDENQRFDHHTTINHLAESTKSSLDFRVALKDKAKSAYTGNLKIAHEAIKSEAKQENRNLLLSPNAKAESIPELEILTNEVLKCSHGVTVGKVDKAQIFYLMSRGLTEKEAEKLIIEGFLEPTVERIPIESLKEEVQQRIQNKLKTL